MPRRPSARTLTVVANTVAHYLDGGGSAVIQTVAPVSDNAGGWTFGTTVHGTVDVFMRPQRANGQIEVAGQAAAEQQEYFMAFGTTVTIALTNQIVYDGGTYEVRNVEYSTGITWTPFQSVRVVKLT